MCIFTYSYIHMCIRVNINLCQYKYIYNTYAVAANKMPQVYTCMNLDMGVHEYTITYAGYITHLVYTVCIDP